MNNKNGTNKRGTRNSKGSKKKNVCGVIWKSQGTNRQQLRASLQHKPNKTKNHHSKNRPRVGETRAFHPEKWKAKQKTLEIVEIGVAA